MLKHQAEDETLKKKNQNRPALAFSILTPRDKLNNHEWLSNNDLFNFMKIVKVRFPLVKGLEDPISCLNSPQALVKSLNFLRIIMSRSNHWVLISGQKDLIEIFDSKERNVIDEGLGEAIGKFVSPSIIKNRIIKFVSKKVQKQTRDYCGYYTLANLTAICFEIDPECIEYDEDELREHYIGITFDGYPFEMFPYREKGTGRKNLRNNALKNKVFLEYKLR